MLKLENIKSGEKIEMVIRRHWIVYVIISLYFLVGVTVTISIFAIFGLNPEPSLFIIVFWMFFSIFLYIQWLNHELDLFIVTNNRIIGIEQISFLNRTVSECNLGEVQEVNSGTKGLFSNVLNYGTINIQTAGTSTNFQMEFAPEPLQNARKILNIADVYKDVKYKNFNNRNLNSSVAEIVNEKK